MSEPAGPLDDLLDHAPCGFLEFNDAGIMSVVNATLAAWLGYARSDLEGRHIDAILTVAGRIFFDTHVLPSVVLQGKLEEVYLSLLSATGEGLPVLTNAVRRERGGRFVTDCVVVPLRQRHRYEAEILRARRVAEDISAARARFLSMMSHDLRTPLQTITTSAYLLRAAATTDQQAAGLRRIESASEELMRLIDGILDYARLESGRMEMRLEDVSAVAAVERAEVLTEVRAQQAGLRYLREEIPVGLTLRTDPDRLQQILMNLLTNAVKFTPPGGTVRIDAGYEGERPVLSVRDTGPGIATEDLERIFQPFVQLARGQAPHGTRGFGLGLAISRDLARAMGADLRVDSAVGKGSVFTLVFPPAGTASPP